MEQVKVDFKKLKSAVPIAAVLEKYGAKMYGNVQLSANCPLPTHTSKDSRSSFKVNADKNVWCCKSDSCVSGYKDRLSGKKGGDVIDLVRLMEDCDILNAAKKLLEWFPQNEKQNSPPKAESNALKGQSNPNPVPEENKVLGFELKGITYHPYLEGRGISKELASQFGIGFFPGKGSMSGRVVIPIRNESGALIAYARRAIDNSEPKYRLPSGFHKSLVLFNRHAVKGDAITITESFFGTMKVVEAGFPAVGLIGCSLSEAQENLLLTFKFITLFLDPDEPGQKATEELAVRLAKNHYVRIARNDKPPDEMTSDEIKNTLRYVCPLPIKGS